MNPIAVTGSFDDLRSEQIRLLEEASQLGELTLLLWSDETIQSLSGKAPKFPLEERRYFLESIRYVSRLEVISGDVDRDRLSEVPGFTPTTWVVREDEATPGQKQFCSTTGLDYRVIENSTLKKFPPAEPTPDNPASERKKVLVTGCYDWFHSGHVRFFEEVSELGDLYVVVGNDANVLQLKGEGHPMYSENERRYIAGSIRFVKQALITTGSGWLDAEPEIQRIQPDIYAVNEDGDRPVKREYCEKNGLEYCVLKRTPKEGLPRRQSTDLRGF